MDLVHDRASMIAEEEEDRISNLPDDIIRHILSFLDMKYAIQTSMLSKKWKFIWTSMPHLNLNSETCSAWPKFSKFVNDALSHRNYHAEVSAVELSFRGSTTHFDRVVRSIVDYAYSHNVRQLSLLRFTLNKNVRKFPQGLFSCHTLKHLTLATHYLNGYGPCGPKSAWDFPVLETLNLSNMQFGGHGDNKSNMQFGGDKSLNLFSKCVNLKDLTLHNCSMLGLDIFNVCAPQLSNLTITDADFFSKVFNVVAPQLSNLTITDTDFFPKVFNVVAPQLETLTASVCDLSSDFLQLSTEDLDSLQKVNLSMPPYFSEKERYAPGLLDLFQKLCGAKFLILDMGIIELLSACLDQLSHEPCSFINLKCLKINKWKNLATTMPTQVRNYLLESSPSATFIMDLPQVPHKISRQEADIDTMANTLEEEKQQTEIVDEEKRMLEAILFRQDEVIAEQTAMLEAMKLQHKKIETELGNIDN